MKSAKTKGVVIEEAVIPTIIDELPIIFVLAALSKGKTVIRGIGELRVKETDRVFSMAENLQNLGARIKTVKDDVIIDGVERLKGAQLNSFGDHRTCMALVIASLAAEGESVIDGVECVSKSFPSFFRTLEKLI